MSVLGIDIAGLGLQAADTLLGSIGSKKRQKRAYDLQSQLNRETAQMNYDYGEMSAEQAHQRSLELQQNQFDNASYVNQVADIQEAGVSPSVLGAGNGGGSGGSGAQGDGARGIQPFDIAALMDAETNRKAVNSENVARVGEKALALAEAEKLRAEKRNIDANTANIETDTASAGLRDKKTEAEIENITQDTENKKVQKAGQELQNEFDKIRNEINAETIEEQIRMIDDSADLLSEGLKEARRNNEIGEKTIDDIIKTIKAEATGAIIDNIEKQAGIELTRRQAKAIGQYINLEITKGEVDLVRLQHEINKTGVEIKLENNRTLGQVIKGLANAVGLLGAAKITTKGKSKKR